MSQILISVRNLEEARIVARHEIGILDVKEPNRGSLGAAETSVLREIADATELGVVKSFSAGELSDWIDICRPEKSDSLEDRYGKTVLSQYRFIKVGLASMTRRADWKRDWQGLFGFLPVNTSAVLVAYLDHYECEAPAPGEIIEFASEQKCCDAVLFDTYYKRGNLFSHLSKDGLSQIVAITKQHNLISVVAGSIDDTCLAAVRDAGPDFIGVRGAVCRDSRSSEIDEALVRNFLTCVGT